LEVAREFEERSATLNSLLRLMAPLQLPAIPTFLGPRAVDFPTQALDSNPLLSSERQSASGLKAEISDLERRLAAALEQVAVREERQEAAERAVRELSDEITVIEKELSVLSAEIAVKSDEVTQLRRERSEAQARLTEMEAEIKAAADIDNVIVAKEAELTQMNEDLANKRRNTEEADDLRKQLLEGLSHNQLVDAD
jgi:chromosome segregation ATPase